MWALRALARRFPSRPRPASGLALSLLVLALLPVACLPGTPGTPDEGSSPESGAPATDPEVLAVPEYMVKGDPDAPITLFEWSDFQCPYCQRHAEATAPLIDEEYVETGKVRVVFRDLPLVSIHEHAQKAAEAARCAGEAGGPDGYWDMYHKLFENQGEWSGEAEAVPSFKTYASEIGVDQAAFDACLDEGQQSEAVMADYEEAIGLGIQATPSFTVQGSLIEGAVPIEQFREKLDIVVAGGQLPTPTTQPTPEMVEVEAPRVEVEIGDAPVKGSEDAPVTIIEFSDYQCPYCKMFVDETYPTLIAEYVETGRVRYAFRDLPLTSIHPAAEPAAQAAHCARDQGGDEAYFEMHDALFAEQEAWGQAESPNVVFGEIATEIGLDGEALVACVEEGTHAETVRVSLDQAVNELGLGGTPTFVINGQVYPGVLTIELLSELVGKAERGEPITMVLPKEYALQLTPQPPAER